MQPPPRTGPPGASGPPPASVGPNAFRRTRPHKHTGAAVMAGLPAQPMTDPFAFGRQAPPPMATGGHPPPPNSSPLPMQAPPPSMYHQAGMGQGLHQPQPLDSAQAGAVPLGPPPPSTPGVSILTPHGTASPVPFPGQLPGPPGHAPPSAEQGYFNSREPAPSMTPGHLPMASAPMSGQAPYGQDHGGDHHPQAMLFKPVPPVLSQWVPDHGSRPPSVQNYFQPTSDPLPQVCNAAPQSQISPHTPLPHSTPPTHPQQQHQPQPPPQHPDRPTSSQWPDLAGANTPQQHNAHFQAQTYFSQSSATLDSWFNQHPQDLVYHQMGAGPGLARPDSARSHYRHDSAGSHHGSHYGTYHASTPGPAPVPFIPDGTISMFFKGNDVENEETLAGEGAGAVNGLQDFQPSHNHQQMSSPQPQPNPVAGAEATHSYRGPPPQAGQSLTYMNDGNFPGAGKPIQQKPAEAQFDHVENLECVPNQEVLPSEHQNSPAAAAAHGGDCYEAGPNLETPDSVPRPIRSASVSSSYSNLSHGSGTGTVPRRHQGVVGTFIQQESPRPSEDAFSSAAAGGYFEQIDTSPAGNMAAAYQSIPERMCHSQPPTPSPPKPTGIFQASANSSFEPVRSHSVAVRPAEVDRARMVAERGSDSLPGNLEQPPDNLENVYGAATGHTQAGDGAGAPPLAYPLSHSHSRPSSRAHVAHRPCESPATTLWAQHDPASLGTNILLVPAAPPVLAPLREPSAEVIQPPEDGSLDLQPPQCAPPPSQHPSENLENPPKVTKDAQQVGRGNEDASTTQIPAEPMSPPVAPNTQQPPSEPPIVPQPGHQGQGDDPAAPLSGAPPPQEQYPPPMQGPATGNAPTPSAAYPGPRGHVPLANPPPPGTGVPLAQPAQPAPTDSQRPPSSLGSQLGYGPPPPGQVYGGYYGGAYPEYPDGRGSYLPAQYPPAPVDPRAQQYYQDDPYMIADPRYGRYEGANPAYPPYREPPPERPSSRTSQYSDRPSSRQGFPPEDYQRANRSAYDDYYAEYYKNQYGDRSRWEGYNASAGTYDPRYRDYYDQNYWYNYNPEAYRGREAAYYNQQPTQQYPAATARPPGYDDKWRYYPGYDASFDDDYRRQKDQYRDDFDRRSVHSEQSAHSLHSSQSHRSRRSSFSSRSQQSEVYRSQPDLTAVYDPAVSTLPVDYSYGQYPEQTDPGQSFSQYPYTSGYQADDSTWVVAEQPPPRPITPEKYSVSHRCARFGPGGQLIQVLPNLPSAGQPALVEIHNMETMLQDTPDQSELRSFPGPLLKEETHKVDVIKFSQNKGLECARNNDLLDKDSAALLWDFIVLLCRQNGTVVGTDIADLLLKEHRSVWLPGKSPNEANLIDFNNEPLARAEEEPGTGPLSLLSDTFMTVPENVGKETERFRELLLFGRKKDALEAAMKGALWGHALLLASKMDSRTHARVMTRFANSLPINDPLQTVYQLMSGRMPASATCCGDEKWGDWRPHLAMVLSNLTHTLDLDTRTITTMGDTLASKGLTDAAHFCYLMAQVGLGVFTKKSTKMVLIGSNHSLSFFQFASNEAIQRTEAYEYAQSLGSQPCSLPNFQVFKLIYACRLAEAGLCAQAFHYCEVISRSVLMQPSYHSPVFTSQLIQMSEKMRFFDPQLKEKADQELFNEPEWLIHLRQLDGQMRTGVIAYNADRDTPQQYDCSTPNSELDQTSPPEPYAQPLDMVGHTSDNPLMTSLMPGPPQQGVQLMPPAPPTILQDGMVSQPPHPNEGVQFYPVPPSLPGPPGQIPLSGFPPQGSGFVQPYQPQQPQPDKNDMFPGAQHQQMAPPQHQQQMMPPPQHQQQMMPPQMQQPQKMPSDDYQLTGPPELQPPPMSTSPQRNTFTPQMDFYDQMAHMGPGRRSRTTSQSSMQMQPPGRRSRTMSESSTHSGGRERSNSAAKQSSPPPPSIPEQAKKDSPKKGGGGGGGGWLNWLYRKGKNEAHLPDDKNKSIVWDEKKQKWVNLDEPEEEYKPPPPPPSGFPKMLGPIPGQGGPGGPPTGGPPVNMFSRRAGTKSRYVDVLNPGGPRAKPGGSAPAPSDFFAPLAPMPMPANLFVPGAEEQQPMEGNVPETGGNQEQSDPNPSAVPQMFNPTLLPPGPVGPPIAAGSPPGEVPLTPQPPPQGAPPSGGVTFYNPAQFAQASTPSGRLLSGRLGGQRAYPVLK
ncbi:protein transport protein Sec16A isoform X3 [Salvelinus sp. IW2-2015]|uniref:protein transport protein Sec16A isoform X3 n=1 Tax=Salvelinus sp. IW2-2015 TaxID=2691554 RepID=UPI000CDFCD0C|nr:protein transport protein Sec16A isoform X3 [Salvelinus alpinus]